jgi:methyl acetate hydrolase
LSMQARIDSILEAGISSGTVAGAAAAVTDRDGTLYESGFGERAAGGGEAITADTVCWIFSMTKPLAGTAAMQLVEQGKLDLHAPASEWIPYLGEVQVLEGFGTNNEPILRAPKRAITLTDLLTHTAGFGNVIWDEKTKRYTETQGLPAANTGDIRGLEIPLVFDPGDRWLYSISIDWVGKMVEAASGKTLGTFMQDHIFHPLGMNSTSFKISPEMRSRLAKVHRRENGAPVPIDMETPQNPHAEMGGGGLYSTVADYLRFVRMILNEGSGNGAQLLKPETVRSMGQNHMGDRRVEKLISVNLERSLDAEFFPGMPKTWGLTFMINNEKAPTGRSANSLAWAGLGNCFFWIDPHEGIGGVFMSQLLPFVDERALKLNFDFEAAVYNSGR